MTTGIIGTTLRNAEMMAIGNATSKKDCRCDCVSMVNVLSNASSTDAKYSRISCSKSGSASTVDWCISAYVPAISPNFNDSCKLNRGKKGAIARALDSATLTALVPYAIQERPQLPRPAWVPPRPSAWAWRERAAAGEAGEPTRTGTPP